ncbi:histidine phosphatase family protein [Lysinibacillus piscis]|uniref:Phosphatase n=1 Tax=Lysinibacillus piscis TaxID=2518931 RepID=A0ABQ5NL95_9BACI|nr:histidine phosphatase family protein [Lysinibacillus sp. KH24]GLC88866.1 phosphatase [Lysinibacillus sp. KH24]
MTTFYMVRHGETIWNQMQRLQGWLDSPLTATGIAQAEKLCEALRDVPFTAAYSSSSGRAMETMRIVLGQRSLSIVEEDGLREIFLGNWQGETVEDIIAVDELSYSNYLYAPEKFQPTHTESFEAVTERALQVLLAVAEREPNGTILIVSHAVTIKCLLNAVLGRELASLWAEPFIHGTSVTTIERVEQQWLVKEIGNITHLD